MKCLGNCWGRGSVWRPKDGFTHMCAWMEMVAGRLNSIGTVTGRPTHGLSSYMVIGNDIVTQSSQREHFKRPGWKSKSFFQNCLKTLSMSLILHSIDQASH